MIDKKNMEELLSSPLELEELDDESMKGSIVVTGAAGFIGSCMVQYLNEQGYEKLVLVDDFGVEEKRRNWEDKRFEAIVERYNLFNWLELHNPSIDFVIHLGARTDTTEFDYAIHQELNVEYSQQVWNYCTEKQIPLIYASSAATYGAGESGYDDNKELEDLHPLNPYGISKNEFDKWALQQESTPPFWAGLKFFNVYGPNEYHKGRMASVIFHAYNQIKKEGFVKLFKSHKEGFENGKQLRDFIYVKDVVKVIGWMMRECKLAVASSQMTDERKHSSTVNHDLSSGIYNLGTGHARTFDDLVKATFAGLDLSPNIQYIDMPEDIRDKYQYYTEATMHKLRQAGYQNDFYSLEEGVDDYVRNYLAKNKIY
ncbi:ADP-glyceromanno-heptose 6-epimerase [Segetibacter aerophilus]|uniref:ADP-L-glycero-D-manno-heptose-6-epimerase n=1 Tax=Segetibacter aerophilus TaxID=670293 RepID=A0A512BBI4_9BACT|nr:ADP-glyceromanno-heptose 6-epimerase [Segetibacter aerophilus]GEO09323.1 ADP-L-glycero-D-manno-heptose-6-epimerase [Segetibacter aerophilus]